MATTALITQLPSGDRIYQVTDTADTSWPATGTAAENNLVLQYGSSLTETDLTYTSVPISGGFSVDALSSGVPTGNAPVQLLVSGPAEGHPNQWAIEVVLFADDAATYGASGDSFRVNGWAWFLVSPIYVKV